MARNIGAYQHDKHDIGAYELNPVVRGIANVQTGTIAFGAANTSRNVTITSVDTTKCFILIDWQTDSSGSVATTQHFRARLTSSTNIAFDRTQAVSGDDGIVRWWAIEFTAGITVRHFTGNSRNTNVSIGATVDLAKTFAIISERSGALSYDDNQIEGVDIVSTTNFQVKTAAAGGTAPNWAVQIIEFDSDTDPVVKAVTITLGSGITTNTGSISAVTVANSMLIGGGTWDGASGQASQSGFSAALDDATTVSVTRVVGTGTLIAYMFVIDWGDTIDIRRGTDTLTTGEGVSETQTFSALDGTDDAVAFMRGGSGTFGAQGNHTGSQDDADYAEISLDSTTQITITRSGSTDDLGPYNWQVIDFSGFVFGEGAVPAKRRYSLLLSGVG